MGYLKIHLQVSVTGERFFFKIFETMILSGHEVSNSLAKNKKERKEKE